MKRVWLPGPSRVRPKPQEPQEALEPLQEPQEQRVLRELLKPLERRLPQAPHELRAPEEPRVPQ